MSSADAGGGRLERRVGRERWQSARSLGTEAAGAASGLRRDTACEPRAAHRVPDCTDCRTAPLRSGPAVRWPPTDGQPGMAHARPWPCCSTAFDSGSATCMERMNCERPTNELSGRRRRSARMTGWARAMARRADSRNRGGRARRLERPATRRANERGARCS